MLKYRGIVMEYATNISNSLNIFGEDALFAIGVTEVFNEIMQEFSCQERETDLFPDIWVFTGNTLVDIALFIQNRSVYKPCVIFGSDVHQRIFSDVPGFNQNFIINASLPVTVIKEKLRLVIEELYSGKDDYSSSVHQIRKRNLPLSVKGTLGLLLAGFSPREIAKINHVSVKVVSNYKRVAMKNFNVKSTQELVMKSWLLGFNLSSVPGDVTHSRGRVNPNKWL